MISNSDYTQDYTHEYQLAETAYLQGNYQQSATIIDGLVSKFSNDPSVRGCLADTFIVTDYINMKLVKKSMSIVLKYFYRSGVHPIC